MTSSPEPHNAAAAQAPQDNPQGLRMLAIVQCLDGRTPQGGRDNVVRLHPIPPGYPIEITGLTGEQLRAISTMWGEKVILQINRPAP